MTCGRRPRLIRRPASHWPSCCDAAGGWQRLRPSSSAGAALEEITSWLPLGNLHLDELDDDVAAEAAYRAGITTGDLFCHHNLTMLLLDRGQRLAAIEQLRIGASGGDELAERVLRELLDEEG